MQFHRSALHALQRYAPIVKQSWIPAHSECALGSINKRWDLSTLLVELAARGGTDPKRHGLAATGPSCG
jgi:hypothetical protein